MATVKITSRICNAVHNAIDRKFYARAKMLTEQINYLDIGTEVYRREIPTKYAELAEQLNTDPDGEWVSLENQCRIQIWYNGKSRTLIVPYIPPRTLPLRASHTWHKIHEGYECYAPLKEICLQIDALEAERLQLIGAIVDGVLRKCSTLKQVLTHWPSALEFMPDDVRQLHMQKVEPKPRRRRSSEIEEVSDDVKTSIAKLRLLQ